MKLLPILLLNVVTVAGGLAVYDQMRSDGPAATEEALSADFVTQDELSRALKRVGQSAPMLSATGGESRLAERVAELESRLSAPPAPVRAAPAASEDDAPPVAGGMASPVIAGDEPTAEEVARMRKVMAKAEAQRRAEREIERLDRTLERLEITLNPSQKTKVIAAQAGYRSKIGNVWRSAFAGGGTREESMDTARKAMEGLRQELTTELTEFMPSGDAQKLSEGMGGMGGGFGGRRGR